MFWKSGTRNIAVLLILLLFCDNIHVISSFSIEITTTAVSAAANLRSRGSRRLPLTCCNAVDEEKEVISSSSGSNDNDKSDSGKTSTLELKGEFQIFSNPLPSMPEEKMAAFFATSQCRDLLATAGGKRECEEIKLPTEDMIQDWKKACDVVGTQYPEDGDVVLSVATGGIDLPGLRLVSKAKIGVKLVQGPNPQYEFTLIGDERKVSGLPPVVWIFNKLTGAGDGNGKKDNTNTSSRTIFSYDLTDDGKTIFKAQSFILIIVKFPAILLKILPTNKEKAEESAGKAITKTIGKDIQASMEAYEKAYKNY